MLVYKLDDRCAWLDAYVKSNVKARFYNGEMQRMIHPMPGEHIGSFEIRSTLFNEGRLLSTHISKLAYKRMSEVDSDIWYLMPITFDGAFIGLLEGTFGSYKVTMLVEEHTNWVECGAQSEYGISINRWLSYASYKRGEDVYHFSFLMETKLFNLFQDPITYCPQCAIEQVQNFGFMWFQKEPCQETNNGHENVYFIGCPKCHMETRDEVERQPMNTLKKKRRFPVNHPSLLSNRIKSVMNGVCMTCELNIWENISGFDLKISNLARQNFEDLFKKALNKNNSIK